MSNHLEAVVIGAGPGGYAAAIRLAQYGKEVTVIERGSLGGNCLNVGCIPTKALITASRKYDEVAQQGAKIGIKSQGVDVDWDRVIGWKGEVVNQMTSGIGALFNKNKINLIEGEASFKDNKTIVVNGEEYTFDDAVIATGKHISQMEGFEYGERILNTTGALSIRELPKSIVIAGGGYLGAQFAGIFARFGAKVTVIDPNKDLIPFMAKDINRQVEMKFSEYDYTFLKESELVRAEESADSVEVFYTDKEGNEQSVVADYVVVDARQVPNTDKIGLENTDVKVQENGRIMIDWDNMQTDAANIYGIGDCAQGYSAAHAYQQAKIAAAIIAGEEKPNVSIMNSTIISSLEIGTVGMDRKEAKEKGYDAQQKKFLFSANGRAVSLNEGQGFIRFVFDKETHKILGAEIVGPQATELIHEMTIAIEKGLTLEDIGETVHAHPTLSEALMDTAELALDIPIHS